MVWAFVFGLVTVTGYYLIADNKPSFLVFTTELGTGVQDDIDPNFYVFLAFGQSNMEGFSPYEPKDQETSERFLMMAAVDCPELERVQGKWYQASAPITRCNTGISPADYFGKTLVAKLPSHIKVGVINVSVGGTRIELFDEDERESYLQNSPDWLKNTASHYNDSPYDRLLSLAKEAQKKGVIKGILLHQGESNTGDAMWPMKVKKVYDRLLQDLNLPLDSVPLLAGEVVGEEQGGKCASMNPIIQSLPRYIPKAYVISSKDCEAIDDGLHFSTAGYRELGSRYGVQMLELLNELY
ncbi:sialate O-acetylesterase [Mongoliitalea daihaiensis]|nr:sialate O-acetylesterase [Mongoliitalea daihaiensis]